MSGKTEFPRCGIIILIIKKMNKTLNKTDTISLGKNEIYKNDIKSNLELLLCASADITVSHCA